MWTPPNYGIPIPYVKKSYDGFTLLQVRLLVSEELREVKELIRSQELHTAFDIIKTPGV